MSSPMEITIKIPVMMLRESRALRINKKINPKDIAKEILKFFKARLKVNISARNSGARNELICIKFACVRVSG
ncbi:MAG: hypothetical protein Q7R53_00690 [bacterium]|nr:hypothetical protein [bacterium]